MCGILGISHSTNQEAFRHALDQLAHRGPDGSGIWVSGDGQAQMGHRRLSILDLSELGKQPMHYQHLSITFNGEIYNFVEIKQELEKKGHRFRSASDTEVVLAAYLEWGAACLSRFNGMWSFCIWDDLKKEFFLSRDRFGKKPLFYAFDQGRFIFGSEMKAIAHLMLKVEISEDFKWCRNNLYLYENTEKCLVKGIKRFPAGSYAYFKPRDSFLKPVQFWNTLDHLVSDIPQRYEDQVLLFRDLFFDSCRLRMRADVPIGTALSGGLDSSATISALAHINRSLPADGRQSRDWQHAFTASFPDSPLDESAYARQVTNHLGIPLELMEVDVADSTSRFAHYFYTFEEIYTTSPVPMIETYRAIKQRGVTVSLDGHGADEILSGYAYNLYEAIFDSRFSPSDIKQIIQTRFGLMGRSFSNADYADLGKYLLRRNGIELLHWLNDKAPYLLENKSLPVPKAPYIKELGYFNSTLYGAFNNSVLPTLLRNFDRASMASSVEIRMPFMDHRLVSLAFSLPWTSKIRNGYTKSILRDALAPYMPSEITHRKAKIGFNTPTSEWMKSGWKSYLLDMVHSADFEQSAVIEAPQARQSVLEVINHPQPSYLMGYRAWNKIAPFFWEKYFLKNLQTQHKNELV